MTRIALILVLSGCQEWKLRREAVSLCRGSKMCESMVEEKAASCAHWYIDKGDVKRWEECLGLSVAEEAKPTTDNNVCKRPPAKVDAFFAKKSADGTFILEQPPIFTVADVKVVVNAAMQVTAELSPKAQKALSDGSHSHVNDYLVLVIDEMQREIQILSKLPEIASLPLCVTGK